MGLASTSAPCGCNATWLMEPADIVYIRYERCAEHYKPEDDKHILEAVHNRRKYDAETKDGKRWL